MTNSGTPSGEGNSARRDSVDEDGEEQEFLEARESFFEPELDGEDLVPPTAFAPVTFAQSNRRISDLFSSKNDHELDTNPAFQRGYVWDKAKASRLIESVLLHVPLPIVYTAEEDDGKEVVIDGQQRLTTFFAFLDGVWPRTNKPFKLTKLKLLPELNGKAFKDLSPDIQRAFKRYGVNIVKIGAGSNPNVKFEIFERLNTGAVTLSEQELRNCINRGPLNDALRKMAKHDTFIKCISAHKPLERMVDVEMVLRFCAFYDRTYLNYNTKMKAFLNDYMHAERNMSLDRLQKLSDVFRRACESTFLVFGTNAFRRYNLGSDRNANGSWERAPNKALYDVIMGWFARYEVRQIVPVKDEIREEFIRISTGDTVFQDAITLGTTDVSRVRARFEIWGDILKKIVTVEGRERRTFSLREKQVLFDADRTCKICSQRIEDIDDAEVDHIVPYSMGGSTSPENGRLTHRYCNRARGSSGAV